MFDRYQKKRRLKLNKEALTQLLVILAFCGAALTEEVINILHSEAIMWGRSGYAIYVIWISAFWCGMLVAILKLVENINIKLKLSSSNPKGDSIPRGAVGVAMMAFDFSAPEEADIWIKKLKVFYVGDSSSDIKKVYLATDGARISPVETLDEEGYAKLKFERPLPINAGETVAVDLIADFERGAEAGGHHSFVIEDEASLVTNANSVSAAFPIKGEIFKVRLVTTGLITLKYLRLTGPNIVGSFSLKSDSAEHQTLYSITLSKNGNLDSSDLKNIYITDDVDTKLTNSITNIEGDKVTFVFDTPYTILESESRDFKIHAETTASGTISFSLAEEADFFSVGCLHGYGKKGQLFGSSIKIQGIPHLISIR